MEKDLILNGIHIGEHSFDRESVKQEIYDRCIKPGYNFVTIRTNKEQVPQDTFLEWAQYLADHHIYFVFLYTIQTAPDGRDSQFDADTVAKMKEIAGEYFIGDMIGETGSSGACMHAGYFGAASGAERRDTKQMAAPPADMKEAHDRYYARISEFVRIDRELGMPDVVSVEATALNKYNAEVGVTIPMLEVMCGNPDVLIANLRGTARATDARLWGTYVAHEWYGGMRHEDILKRKRLDIAYKYCYLAGTNVMCLESGDECLASFGHQYPANSPLCEEYRSTLQHMTQLIQRDARPKGGPKVKVAFVSGLHDAWGGWGGSSVWSRFHTEEWGHNEAEHAWRIADEIGTKRTWADIANYGDSDDSALPAYGMFDIVPIEAPLEKLCRYEYLIFLGWNSMTDANMDKLTAYVRQGGRLLMTAAHLNRSVKRSGELDLPDNSKLEALFGARFTGEIRRTNGGAKFRYEALDKTMLYPGTLSLVCDPLYSAGYVDYARFDITSGYESAFISESFRNDPSDLPAMIEHQVGDGFATLITSTNYPGHPALLPLYRAIVREWISSSARHCEIKVIAGDRVRYAVYEGGRMYLLNTDYDLPAHAKITRNGREETICLAPMELKILE